MSDLIRPLDYNEAFALVLYMTVLVLFAVWYIRTLLGLINSVIKLSVHLTQTTNGGFFLVVNLLAVLALVVYAVHEVSHMGATP